MVKQRFFRAIESDPRIVRETLDQITSQRTCFHVGVVFAPTGKASSGSRAMDRWDEQELYAYEWLKRVSQSARACCTL